MRGKAFPNLLKPQMIFISYSRVDQKIANDLVTLLDNIGVSCFLDRKDIDWGVSVTNEIHKGLSECWAVVVILSPASLKSQWVPYEIGRAAGQKKRILPLLTHPSLDIPGYMKDLNFKLNLDEVKKYFELNAKDIQLSSVLVSNEKDILGGKTGDFGILNIYSDSSSYIKEYPIKSFVDDLSEGSELFMFGRNLMYSSPGFDETYKKALRRGLSINLICHKPNTYSEFIRCVSELNPDESLTPISKFRSFLSWIAEEKPPGKLALKYYVGDMLDSVFCIKENQKVIHLSWELSFGRTRETDKRVLLLDPDKILGQDIIKRYLIKIFQFADTTASYDGQNVSTHDL